MKLVSLLLIVLVFSGGCTAPEAKEGVVANTQDAESVHPDNRSQLAADVMTAFGYKPEQFEGGKGMATIDDFSAPRSSGGPAGYLLVSIDGIAAKRGGPNPEVDYVPYVWVEQGTHEFEFHTRPEMSSELNRPERVVSTAQVEEGINYRPSWNGKGLDLVVW